jgi:hypothetical protein
MSAAPISRAESITCFSNGRPGERLQHLRQVGLHALALAGGQDDDGNWH